MKRICLFVLLVVTVIAQPLYAKASLQIPSVLSEQDIERYRRIFALQEKERWQEADRLIARLDNKILMGHVLAQRYIESVTWRTRASEIEKWFRQYGRQTEADRMYQLGKIKKARLRRKPKALYGSGTGTCTTVVREDPIDKIRHPSLSYLSVERGKKARSIMNRVYRAIVNRKTLTAKRLLQSEDSKNLLNVKIHDSAWIALGFAYFQDGRDDLALEVLRPAIRRSGKTLPLGLWAGGLSAWRSGKLSEAAEYFEQLVSHPKANDLLRASGAFWASRTYLKMGRLEQVNAFLEKGKEYPRTFYGMLSARALGEDLIHTWVQPEPLPEEQEIKSVSDLKRIYALKEIGKDALAEREMAAMYLRADKENRPVLAFIAEKAEIASDLPALTGQTESFGKSRYPAPNWEPLTGWKIDKALVFAFVRQESCFYPRAKSAAGALGLMQLMPDTAKEMARKIGVKWDREKTLEPAYNLALGQAYLEKLLKDKKIGNNVIYLAAAYNSGPGNLYKWKRQIIDGNDPFLFIESIPSKETRAFVERIVTNYWIYRTLFGQPTYSLDHVLAGKWPLYYSFDEPEISDK